MESSSLLPSWVVWLGRRLGVASMGREPPVSVGGGRVGNIAEWQQGA